MCNKKHFCLSLLFPFFQAGSGPVPVSKLVLLISTENMHGLGSRIYVNLVLKLSPAENWSHHGGKRICEAKVTSADYQ